MKIDVASIRKIPGETHFFEFREEIPPFEVGGSQVSFTEPTLIRMHVANTGVSLSVKGEITGTLELYCSRCLEPFQYNLKTTFEEQYRHVSETGDGDDNDNRQTYQVYDGDTLDLTDVVRESTILAIPMKSVCNSGCRGICPICGVNKNREECNCKNEEVDPRLAVLKDFFHRS